MRPSRNVLKIRYFLKFIKNTCTKIRCGSNCRSSGLNIYQKETPLQMLFFELCEAFKNIFFTEHLWITFSVSTWKQNKYMEIKFNLQLQIALMKITLTVYWCFQGLEKGCIVNEWIDVTFTMIISFYYLLWHIYDYLLPYNL